MIGIGTPNSQSKIPRPIACSFVKNEQLRSDRSVPAGDPVLRTRLGRNQCADAESPCLPHSSDRRSMSIDLRGKRVLVTRGSGGIGSDLVRAFSRAGAYVAVNYVGNDGAAKALIDEVGHGLALAINADISDEAKVEVMFEAVDARWNGLDVLTNKAWINRKPAWEMSFAEVHLREPGHSWPYSGWLPERSGRQSIPRSGSRTREPSKQDFAGTYRRARGSHRHGASLPTRPATSLAPRFSSTAGRPTTRVSEVAAKA